jgi:hypothetical protein
MTEYMQRGWVALNPLHYIIAMYMLENFFFVPFFSFYFLAIYPNFFFPIIRAWVWDGVQLSLQFFLYSDGTKLVWKSS